MKKLALLFVALALPCFGQGYDKTKWGMDVPKVKATYPETDWNAKFQNPFAQTVVDGVKVIGMKSSVSDIPIEITFEFGPNGLYVVTLMTIPTGNYETDTKAVETIRNGLLAKYGNPTREGRNQIWQTEGTKISYSVEPINRGRFICVSYSWSGGAKIAGL